VQTRIRGSGAQQRSTGAGGALLDWLVHYARTHHGAAIHLDSGVQQPNTHRIQDRKRLPSKMLHFVRPSASERDDADQMEEE
jgi:hypothetical protein